MKIIQDFIISLYNQLFYMSLIATIIGCFILIFRKITNKKLEPRCHYIIWVIFVIALIFPVTIPSKMSIYNFIDLRRENRQYANDTLSLASNVNELEVYNNIKDKISSNNHENGKNFSKIMLDIIFVVFLIKLCKSIISYIVLNCTICKNEVEDERINKILENCKQALKIKRNIKIMEQENIRVPSIIGIFEIKILFTHTTLLLSDNELKSIIMHELSHYKRRDILMNWLIMIIKELYWFNPAISLFFVYMKMDMELATDSLAISKMEDITDTEYCDVILKIAGLNSVKIGYVLGLVSAKEKLNNRIDAIFQKEEFKKYSVLMLISTIFMMLFMLLILYPTSYESFEVPKLYLQLEDGSKIDISKQEEIKLLSGSNFKLLAEGGDYKKIVLYEKHNLITDEKDFLLINLGSNIEIGIGEYIYKFILDYNDEENVSYTVKIKVE